MLLFCNSILKRKNKKEAIDLHNTTIFNILWNAFKKIPSMFLAIISFVSGLVSLESKYFESPIFPMIVNTIASLLWPICAFLFVIYGIYKLARNHLDDVGSLEAQYKRINSEQTNKHKKEIHALKTEYENKLIELQEMHEQEVQDLGLKILARMDETPVIDFCRNGTKEELTTLTIPHAVINQLVSIRIDDKWDNPSRRITIGRGVIVEVAPEYSIIHITEKNMDYAEAWDYICDANRQHHHEQLKHTTISGVVTSH